MQLTFPTYEFVFFFLPVVLAGYYLTCGFLRRQASRPVVVGRMAGLKPDRLFLTGASLLFYLSFGLYNFLILCLQAIIGWLFYLLLQRTKRPGPRSYLMATAVAGALTPLAFFKYGPVSMPVALSFTTFSLLSFLTDAYRGEEDDAAFGDYLLFYFFFPKLLQGPITRYADFMKTVRTPGGLPDGNTFAQAVFCFVLGLSKKVLLADRLARPVDFAYRVPGDLLWMEAVLAVVAYAFQIYFDFSGYCDMGRAVARMLGYDLPRNFRQPYRSQNILEFWRRWHSTLSQFFTRYVYIPLGGNRKGRVRMLAITLLIFLLSGIWHGSGWGFLLWGAAHGLLACTTKLLPRPLRLPRALKTLFTFLFVTAAWIPFRAVDPDVTLAMLRVIADKPWLKLHNAFIDTWTDNLLWYPLKVLGVPDIRTGGTICLWIVLAVSALLIFAAPDAQELSERFGNRLAARSPASCFRVGLAALCCAGLFLWCVLSFGEVSSFVYFQF